MRQVRRGVFETNSSSSHSISFASKLNKCDYSQLKPDDEGFIWCYLEEFGWGYYGDYPLNSAILKLDYLVTQIYCQLYIEDDEDFREEIMNSSDFKMLEEDIVTTLKKNGIKVKGIKVAADGTGRVDHQSICFIKNILPDGCETYSDFIFNPAYSLIITDDCSAYSNLIIGNEAITDEVVIKEIGW